MVRLTFIALTLFAFHASAEVYKSVDKYGNVTYTDDPAPAYKRGEKTEKVNVPPTNIVPAGKAMAPDIDLDIETEEKHPDYQVRIISPSEGHTLTPGQRDLVIAVTTQAPLRHEAKFAFYMDGKQLGTTELNNYSIREIIRGEHTIRVDVLDSNEHTLSSSAPVTVYVHRASVN
ncbi:DUF4124 domain-containing protein [Gilvimarinus agarilyticus]|uniref:DUF4124 domain-containing protein n=1 Tax=Gilvimarinus sp. 2_MG-2023 TaxID=3062666 RepID=UPI001C09CA11|nr:DUF4124 domain-containing protein [Gilvimarinus sp. 2_MG-2023]MBU2887801.1 DUF4124 domain-containing protein [Gilvimarinus agarilyticus]MDO6572440.1 DUF4124 domain-containing protein [Gilvimarinus sp. 2_MG-2023]